MTALIFGVDGNSSNGHSATWSAAGVKGDRGGFVEYSYSEPELLAHLAGTTASYADGCLPVVLIGVEGQYLGKITPANYAKAFREAVEKVRTENPNRPYYAFEIINEPYDCGPNGSNAADYAAICKATYEAVEAAGIPLWPHAGGVMLLVAAHLTYQKKTSETVGGEFSDYTTGHGWIKDFAEAWPESLTKVNGWTSHPYGKPREAAHEGNNGIRSAKVQHENAVACGFNTTGTNNWWVTEFGYNVGGAEEKSESVKTNAEQASKLQEALEELQEFHSEGWLKAVFAYADEDGGWTLWGKEAQTVLTTWAAAHAVEEEAHTEPQPEAPPSPEAAPPGTLSETAERVYDQLAPTFFRQDGQHSFSGWNFTRALASMIDPAALVVQPQADKPPYAVLFDMTTCPTEWLPWVAQFVGIMPSKIEALIARGQEALAREWIEHPIQFNRGKVSAMELAARATLTGTKVLYFYVRYNGEAFTIKAASLAGQTPNPKETKAAIESMMAAWCHLEYETVEGGTLGLLEASHPKVSEVESAHATTRDAELHPEK